MYTAPILNQCCASEPTKSFFNTIGTKRPRKNSQSMSACCIRASIRVATAKRIRKNFHHGMNFAHQSAPQPPPITSQNIKQFSIRNCLGSARSKQKIASSAPRLTDIQQFTMFSSGIIAGSERSGAAKMQPSRSAACSHSDRPKSRQP